MDKTKKISYIEAFKFAFNAIADNIWTYFKIFLVVLGIWAGAFIFLMISVMGLLAAVYKDNNPNEMIFGLSILQKTPSILLICLFIIMCIFAIILIWILAEYFSAAMIKVGLKLYNNEKIETGDLFSIPKNTFFRFVNARLWFTFKVILGLIFLIIPGLIIATKYYFSGYSILDKDQTITEDIEYSKQLTDGAKMQILGFMLIIFILSIVNKMLFYILIPFMSLAKVYIYKQLETLQSPLQ